jgi:CRISPR-associated endoribonuclease Cas6
MLIAVVIHLVAEQETLFPFHLGRAVHASVLERIAGVDPALAATLHAADGPKPLTCSDLFGGRSAAEGRTLEAGAAAALRVTGLTAPVAAALTACLLDAPPAAWRLAGHDLRVARVACDPALDGWSGRTTYEALAAAQLARMEHPDRQVTLDFYTPTLFKSGDMHMPVPLPHLVFGNLVDRWNAFSPIVLSPEVRRFGAEMVAISRYKLESRAVAFKEGSQRIGGVGRVTYRALGGDRYWLGVMQMLADFAFYSGVGALTTAGFGQARRALDRVRG